MGLFKFLSDMGEKMAGLSDAQLKEKIEKDLPGKIANLNVTSKDGDAKISGECENDADREKAILILGNIKGIKSVDDSGLKVKSKAGAGDSDFYTIVKGDALFKIAQKFYGDSKKWPALFEANREVIKDANLIYPGQVIRIPKNV